MMLSVVRQSYILKNLYFLNSTTNLQMYIYTLDNMRVQSNKLSLYICWCFLLIKTAVDKVYFSYEDITFFDNPYKVLIYNKQYVLKLIF